MRFIDPDGMYSEDFLKTSLEWGFSYLAVCNDCSYAEFGKSDNAADNPQQSTAKSNFFTKSLGNWSREFEKQNEEIFGDGAQQGGPFGSVQNFGIPSGPFTGSNADGTTYFEGVSVHTTEVGAIGQGAAGTLPGVGIFVNPKDKYNIDLLRHEFGHILQARKWGNDFFYGTIVPVSLISADAANKGSWDHSSTWTEWTANLLSWRYFEKPADWNMNAHPIYPVMHSNILAYPPSSISLKD